MFARFRRGDEMCGFAMSGGGARGACQVGALKALTEAGIWPQILAGSSAGAVNAAWFALHPHRLDRMEAIWLSLRRREVFPGGRLRTLLNLSRHGYVHASRAWEDTLRREFGRARFEDASIACAVVAVRLSDGERVVFDSGDLVSAIMASTAIPGGFPPYRVGDELYIDGGVLEYLPIPTLLERRATVVFALDCSGFVPSPNPASVVDRSDLIAAGAAAAQMAALEASRGNKVHLLRPPLPELEDARDFRYTAALIAAGYEHTKQYVQERGLGRRVERRVDDSGSGIAAS